jgi:hypothetical protein
MKVHVLVEGPSELAFFDRWLPRAFARHEFVTHPHQGKGSFPRHPEKPPLPRRFGLLDLLPATLRAYSASPEMKDVGVLIVVDADNDVVVQLEQRIVEIVRANAPTRAVVCLAIEETEAYYLGDLRALKAAFPSADMVAAGAYVPDSIVGTAERFGEIVGDDGLRKVAWAETMGERVTTDPAKSRSPSFRALHKGIKGLVAEATSQKPKRKKHWKTQHSALRKVK